MANMVARSSLPAISKCCLPLNDTFCTTYSSHFPNKVSKSGCNWTASLRWASSAKLNTSTCKAVVSNFSETSSCFPVIFAMSDRRSSTAKRIGSVVPAGR